MLQRLQNATFSSALVGDDTLLIGCANQLMDRELPIEAVVTDSEEIAEWARGANLRTLKHDDTLAQKLSETSYDWLFSIANLRSPRCRCQRPLAGSTGWPGPA